MSTTSMLVTDVGDKNNYQSMNKNSNDFEVKLIL